MELSWQSRIYNGDQSWWPVSLREDTVTVACKTTLTWNSGRQREGGDDCDGSGEGVEGLHGD